MSAYTDREHLKALLAGRATPAFTPLTVDAAKLIDPAFVPGMGAFKEDEHGRLQCPVRGCGRFVERLGQHLSLTHRGAGGAAAVRQALDVPKSMGLVSAKVREKLRETSRRSGAGKALVGRNRKNSHGERQRRFTTGAISVARRNFADTCPAQLQAKLFSLSEKLGRSPSALECRRELGENIHHALLTVFGTYNNAKALAGLSVRDSDKRTSVDAVMESMRTWHNAHGDLPSGYELQRGDRAPMTPSYPTILKALGVSTWEAAVRTILTHTGLPSERYGKPTRRAG